MSDSKLYVGIDLGGTKIDAGLVDATNGKLTNREQVPTDAEKGDEAVLKKIVDLIKKVKGQEEVVGVGVGIPGFIDYDKGLVIDTPHLTGFQDLPVREMIKKESGLPTAIENDANCFTWAEFKFGAAKDLKHVVGMTIGTGIGGGVIINGEMYHGAFGGASEMGHMIISSGRRPGFKGRQGLLDVYGSARGLIRTYEEFAKETATPQEIQKEAESGNESALRAVKRTSHYLAVGLNNVAVLLNPEMIVLGGGLSQFELLMRQTSQKFQNDSLPITSQTRITKGALGRDGGIIGAALIAAK